MKGTTLALATLLATAGVGRGQDPESCEAVAERVFAGGWFMQAKYRRSDSGVLEMDYFADTGRNPGDPSPRWLPLCGEKLDAGFTGAGLIGLLTLLYHGPADLVASTDVEFHFHALGIDSSEVGLRQLLVTPARSFEGDAGKAVLFDKLLAIEHLVGRRCRGARAELIAMARDKSLPDSLQRRADAALARLEGKAVKVARQHLTVAELTVPRTFDAGIVVKHSRLPHMGWLTPGMRRLVAEVYAATIQELPRDLTDAMRNGCQRYIDAAAELPFALAHRHGNARIDHSVLFVSERHDGNTPLDVAWQAAGAFDPEGLRTVEPPQVAGAWRIRKFEATKTRASGCLGPLDPSDEDTAAKILLGDTDAAVRVFLPASSVVWEVLRADGFPTPRHAEVLLRFDDEPSLEARVTTANDADAKRWTERAQRRCGNAGEWLKLVLPDRAARHDAFLPVVRAIKAARPTREQKVVRATFDLGNLSAPSMWSLLTAVVVDR